MFSSGVLSNYIQELIGEMMNRFLYSVWRNIPVKLLAIIAIMILLSQSISSQGSSPNDYTRMINKKLKVLSSPSPDVPGGYVRDNSYEGLKGSPYLFNVFKPVFIKVRDIDTWVFVEANFDLKKNSILYKEPETGQLYSVPADRIAGAIVKNGNDTLIYKTTKDIKLKPDPKENKFYRVLKEGPVEFIEVPFKILIPADYAGAYTAQRRFDEYKTEYNYYVLSSDKVYKQIKLSKKTLIGLFPERKDMITEAFKEKVKSNNEIALSLLEQL